MPNDAEKMIIKPEFLMPGMILSAELYSRKYSLDKNGKEFLISGTRLGAAGVTLTEKQVARVQENFEELKEFSKKPGNRTEMTIQVYKSMALPTNVKSTFSEEELVQYSSKISSVLNSEEIDQDMVAKMIEMATSVQKRIESSIFLESDINTVVSGKESVDNHVRNVTIAAIAIATEYNKNQTSEKDKIKMDELALTTMLYKTGSKYKKNPEKLVIIEKRFNHTNRGYTVREDAHKTYYEDMETVYAHDTIEDKYSNSILKAVKGYILFYKENKFCSGPLKYKCNDKKIISQILRLCDYYYDELENQIDKQKAPHEILKNFADMIFKGEFSKELYEIILRKVPIYPRGSKVLLSNGMVATVVVPDKENPSKPIVSLIVEQNENGKKVLKEGEISLLTRSDITIKRFLGEGFDSLIDLNKQREREMDILTDKYNKIIYSLYIKNAQESDYEFLKAILRLNTINLDMIHSDIHALFDNKRIGDGNPILRQKITEQIKSRLEKISMNDFRDLAEFCSKNKNTSILVKEKEEIDAKKNKRKEEKELFAKQKVFNISQEINRQNNDALRQEMLKKAFDECITEEEKERLIILKEMLYPTEEETTLQPVNKQK